MLKLILILVIGWIGYAMYNGTLYETFEDVLGSDSNYQAGGNRQHVDYGGGPAATAAGRPDPNYWAPGESYAGARPSGSRGQCENDLVQLKAAVDHWYNAYTAERSPDARQNYQRAKERYQAQLAACMR